MWWANLAGWPNGASEGDTERCIDKAFGGMVGELQDGSSVGSLRPANDGKYALPPRRAFRIEPKQSMIAPDAPIFDRNDMSIRKPQAGAKPQGTDPRHWMLLAGALVIVAVLIFRK